MQRVVIGSAVSGALGVICVSGGANAIEKDPPPFSLKGDRFDLSSFKGRFYQQLRNCDPASLLASEKEVRLAEERLEAFRKNGSVGEAVPVDAAQLWHARKIVEANVHPDTKEIIPAPFRMSGYVPFNGPVCVGMMCSQTTAPLLAWSWVNQSQNALVNFFNRNASSETSNETLAISYCGAVGAALSVALGLSLLIKKTLPPARAVQVMKFVAFPSSIVASCSNCYIMRSPEIGTGIPLVDGQGVPLANGAKSSIAAKKAVYETVFSRALLQVPVFFIPAATMSVPPIAAACAASPSLSIPLTTLVTILSFGFGLPAAVGYFPQMGQIDVERLEDEIQELLPSDQKVVFYNKGL